MSAFLVHTDTIDLIVSAANRYGTTFYADRSDEHPLHGRSCQNQIGQILLDQNLASVNYRYRETAVPVRYTWRPVSLESVSLGDNPDLLVLAAIRCLRYQSCETPNYDQSLPARLLDRIEADAIRYATEHVYAPWEWTREKAKQREQELRQQHAARIAPSTVTVQ